MSSARRSRYCRSPLLCTQCLVLAGYLAYVGYYCLSAGASLASGKEVIAIAINKQHVHILRRPC